MNEYAIRYNYVNSSTSGVTVIEANSVEEAIASLKKQSNSEIEVTDAKRRINTLDANRSTALVNTYIHCAQQCAMNLDQIHDSLEGILKEGTVPKKYLFSYEHTQGSTEGRMQAISSSFQKACNFVKQKCQPHEIKITGFYRAIDSLDVSKASSLIQACMALVNTNTKHRPEISGMISRIFDKEELESLGAANLVNTGKKPSLLSKIQGAESRAPASRSDSMLKVKEAAPER